VRKKKSPGKPQRRKGGDPRKKGSTSQGTTSKSGNCLTFAKGKRKEILEDIREKRLPRNVSSGEGGDKAMLGGKEKNRREKRGSQWGFREEKKEEGG